MSQVLINNYNRYNTEAEQHPVIQIIASITVIKNN